jgi:hypothetical protein
MYIRKREDKTIHYRVPSLYIRLLLFSERKNWKREQQKEPGRFGCRLHPEMYIKTESLVSQSANHPTDSIHSVTTPKTSEICHDFAVSTSYTHMIHMSL